MISLRPRPTQSRRTSLSSFGLTAAVTLFVLVASITGGAAAYFATPGSGSGSAALGTLPPPTGVLVPATSAGTVTVSWTASVGTPQPTGYYATRTETATGATDAACGTSLTSTVSAATCHDLAVRSGQYTYTVTAVYNGWTAASAPSTDVTVATPTRLAFETQPSSATSGTVFTSQPAVAIQNAAGETVPGATGQVTLAITGSPVGVKLICAQNSVSAVSGIATFSGCRIDRAGSYTLTATASDTTAAMSSTVTIAAGTATTLAFTTQPSGATGGTTFGTQPVVTVQDAWGNPVTSSTVSVTATSTAPSLTCSPASNTVVASAGVAAFAGCAIASAGTYTLTATAGQLTATSDPFSVVVGGPAKLAFTTQPPTTSTAGEALSATVTVQDPGGNTVTESTNLVTLGVTGGSTTCGSSTPVSGIASFTGCKIDKAGTYALSATSGSLAPAQSTSVTITAGAAAAMVFSTGPANATGGLAFGTQPVVTVRDAFGNPVTAAVTLGIPAGATLTCDANPLMTGSGTSAPGVAAFAGCRIDKASSTPYSVTATSGSLTVTSTITVAVGTPSKLFFAQPAAAVSSTGGIEFAGTAQPVVIVQDAGGNTVTGSTATVTLGITGAPVNARLSCTTNTVAAVSGVATFSRCAIDKANAPNTSYTLTASSPATSTTPILTGVSRSITIAVGPAAKLVLSQVPGTLTKTSTFSPTVVIQDAGGNVVNSSANVALSATPLKPGTLTCPAGTSQAAAAGSATFSSCNIDKSGSYLVTAAALGLSATANLSVTNN